MCWPATDQLPLLHSPVTITIARRSVYPRGWIWGRIYPRCAGPVWENTSCRRNKNHCGLDSVQWTPLKPLLGLNTTAVSISTVSRGKANTLLFVVLSTQMSTQGWVQVKCAFSHGHQCDVTETQKSNGEIVDLPSPDSIYKCHNPFECVVPFTRWMCTCAIVHAYICTLQFDPREKINGGGNTNA